MLAHVRYAAHCGPKSDIASLPRRAISRLMQCSKIESLFDHLVGTGQQRGGHVEAQFLRSLDIDN
jgi:hypothetical protein